MFKDRIIITLKKIGMAIGAILLICLFMVFLWWICTFPPDAIITVVIDKGLTIMLWIIGIIMGLVVTIYIVGYIIIYLNWQFIEPYREYKNRRKNNDG